MKKVLFIGNRPNVLRELVQTDGLEISAAYILEDSYLSQAMNELALPKAVAVKTFTMKDKRWLLGEIAKADFDLLVSNGCPFILPVSNLKKEHQLFVNIHPTMLPYLKGKTPLNGVFMTHVPFLAATVHYIDDDIDTGRIIHQEKVEVTDDIDQGLVYKISFDLEAVAFRKGIQVLAEHDFNFAGSAQEGEGSYFNRTDELQTVDVVHEPTDMILDKVKSFGIKGQGCHFVLGGTNYRVYAAEKIINPFILDTYVHVAPGEIAFSYDEKLVVKTTDGMIKLTRYETEEAATN